MCLAPVVFLAVLLPLACLVVQEACCRWEQLVLVVMTLQPQQQQVVLEAWRVSACHLPSCHHLRGLPLGGLAATQPLLPLLLLVCMTPQAWQH